MSLNYKVKSKEASKYVQLWIGQIQSSHQDKGRRKK